MLYFHEMGYVVSKPFGDNSKYDIIVDRKDTGIKRIQVKSTASLCFQRTLGYYNVSTSSGTSNKQVYEKGSIDYFAIFIHPVEAYYLIPAEIIKGRSIKLYPHRKTKNRYEKYRLK